jgi:mgtE-like transporter
MIFKVGGLFAGRTAILLTFLQENIGWVFLIYPLLLTVRGDINGILSGKLGTALHLGIIQPKWRKNNKRFFHLAGLIFVISIYDSILVGVVATFVGFLLGISMNLIDVIVISVSTFLITAIFSMILTFSLTFFIFRNKGDPDVYIYPIMSTVNDILITIIFFGVSFFYRVWKPNILIQYYFGVPISIICILLAILLVFVWRKENYFKSGLLQAMPTLTLTNFIAAGTGTILATFQTLLESNPIILVVYPAVISTIGGQGSILANTTSTKLHLGTIEPSFSFYRSQDFLISFFGVMIAGIILSILYSSIGVVITKESVSFVLFIQILLILLSVNIIAYLVITAISISAAFLTYKFGLDPDNLVTPLLSSSADLITTALLLLISLPLLK